MATARARGLSQDPIPCPVDAPAVLVSDSFCELVELIASPAPNPGAGATAALVTTLAAALMVKVSRPSIGAWPEAGAVVAQAERLRQRAAPMAEANAQAYERARGALTAVSDPHDANPAGAGSPVPASDLGASLDEAAAVPLRIAEVAADIVELATTAAGHAQYDMRPDALIAARLADACVSAATDLVEVNLGVTQNDERLERARALRHQSALRCRATGENTG